MTFSYQRRGPKQDPPDRLSGDFRMRREKISILQDSVKCALHIRSNVKLETIVNSVLLCFTKGLVLRNTIQ